MTIRRTSREAYEEIAARGLLSEQRFAVYAALHRAGPSTSHELARWMDEQQVGQKETRAMVSRRLPELRDSGVVVETRERACRVTGRTCIEWQTTTALPSRLGARASSARVAAMRRTIAELSRELEQAKAARLQAERERDDLRAANRLGAKAREELIAERDELERQNRRAKDLGRQLALQMGPR